jgi:hypothetical protein
MERIQIPSSDGFCFPPEVKSIFKSESLGIRKNWFLFVKGKDILEISNIFGGRSIIEGV